MIDKVIRLEERMNIAKMGGPEIYAKYLALIKRSYLITPFENKIKSKLDYFVADGAANWGHNIFHYCKLDILKEIIKSKQLRFSDISHLKDKTEFKEAVRILKMAVERKNFSMDNELYNILTDQDILDEIKSYSQRYPFYLPINQNRDIDSIKPICKVYTCSFSMDGDSYPMWKDYAKGIDGVSIKFTELKNYMKTTDEDKVKIVWGKVWYTEEDKTQCVEALLEDIIELFSEIPDKKCRKEMVQTVLISTINNMRIFMKHETFKPEEEYRAALIVPEEVISNNKLPDNYKQGTFQRENIVIPCIDVPFDLESINDIIITPKGDFDLLNVDLKDWLQRRNLNKIRICKSNVHILKIIAKNVNVDVRLASNGQYSYDYDSSKFTVTIDTNGSIFKIKVTAKSGATKSWKNRIIVYIPDQTYTLITGISKKSGLNLPAVNADITVKNKKGAVSVSLPFNYSKIINYRGVSGSGSLTMGSTTDFAINAKFSACAISVPKSWSACSNGSSSYSYTSGNGTAKINVKLKKCSFALNK